MAIVQASLVEEILNRQEKAVLRGIYRASQLAEALNALDKVNLVVTSFGVADAKLPASCNQQYTELRTFLANAIHVALSTTKVPSIKPVVKETPSPTI